MTAWGTGTTRRAVALALVVVLATVVGCTAAPTGPHRFTEIVMGVEARVTVYAADAERARRGARAAFDRMIELDQVMSDHRDDSELMRLVHAAAAGPVVVSDDLHDVLSRAAAVSAASDGAFDVTVGPIVQLWRTARREGRRPDPETLAAARARTGWRMVELGDDPPTVTLRGHGMQLDLGGIGKGFAAEKARLVLERAGLARCLVDLGGDLAIGEPPPGRSAWVVEVGVAVGGDTGAPLTLQLSATAVATSGDTVQFVEIDGVRYSHIVDPRTGLGLTNRVAVTVIAPDAALADALASAVSVLGPEAGLALMSRYDGASVMIETAGDDGSRVVRGPGFPGGRDERGR